MAFGDWTGSCSSEEYAYDGPEEAWDLALQYCGGPDDDVDYLVELVAAVSSAYSVDAARVTALGHSNGAALANKILIENDDHAIKTIITQN